MGDWFLLWEPTLWAMACRGALPEIAHGVGSYKKSMQGALL